jgi:hypothetical protein
MASTRSEKASRFTGAQERRLKFVTLKSGILEDRDDRKTEIILTYCRTPSVGSRSAFGIAVETSQ